MDIIVKVIPCVIMLSTIITIGMDHAIATIIMSIGTTNTINIFNNTIGLVWVTKLKNWNYKIWYFHVMVCRHMITINKTNDIMWLFKVYFIINYNINTCNFKPNYCWHVSNWNLKTSHHVLFNKKIIIFLKICAKLYYNLEGIWTLIQTCFPKLPTHLWYHHLTTFTS
jgi:hypothetical protein